MEIKNPVVQEMLNELRSEWPEIWPLVQQWLETPHCLHLIHLLSSSPNCWLSVSDWAGWIEGEEAEVQAALHLLLEQGIVSRLEIAEVETTFYRLTDQEPGTEMIAHFQTWCQDWKMRLEAANQVLGRDWR